MYVKPLIATPVPDPARGDDLPPEGREIGEYTQYWMRRVLDGDVAEAPNPATQAATTKKVKD